MAVQPSAPDEFTLHETDDQEIWNVLQFNLWHHGFESVSSG